MSNDTYVTIRGYAGGSPTVYQNEGGTTVVLRVGVTPRNFNRESGEFRDGTTAWYSIRCYGSLGENVKKSVGRGTPVIVRGKLSPRTWQDKDGISRVDNTIAADALGIELSTGTAFFTQVKNHKLDPVDGEPAGSASAEPEPDEGVDEGAPVESEAEQDGRADANRYDSAPNRSYDPAGNLASVH
ncbi:MAG: single-stranded DNA-binding protein [Ancrocorticia sp.]